MRATIAELPVSPGVYLFKNAAGRVLYVGKAINLRSRVRSYFADDTGRGALIEEMVRLAKRVDVEPTDSEIEAILLEANLIRKLKPKYNSLGKDDKSAHFIHLTWSEPYPRLHLVRGRDIESGAVMLAKSGGRQDKLFGPYMVAGGMASIMRVIRRIWPYRDCSPTKYATYAKLGRGCLYYQLGRCPAPCANGVTETEYRKTVSEIVALLSGKKAWLVARLERQMETLARREDYEAAASVRDRLFALNHLHSVARRGIIRGFEDRRAALREGLTVEAYDCSHNQGEYAVGALIRAIVPRTDSGYAVADIDLRRERYRRFKIRLAKGGDDYAMLAEVLARRLRRARKEPQAWSLPDIILIDGGAGQLSVARQLVKGAGARVPVVAVAKGPTRRKADLYIRPADRTRIPLTDPELEKVALQLREEAHRYVIHYYRLLHRHALTPRRKGV